MKSAIFLALGLELFSLLISCIIDVGRGDFGGGADVVQKGDDGDALCVIPGEPVFVELCSGDFHGVFEDKRVVVDGIAGVCVEELCLVE